MPNDTFTAWVLYDGSCGFCRWWVPFWEPTLAARGFGIAPLQADWVRERLALPEDELTRDLRLLFADGRQLQGADVYRHILERIWWAWPLSLFATLPIGRQVFDWGYNTFAANRFLVSRMCRLSGNVRW